MNIQPFKLYQQIHYSKQVKRKLVISLTQIMCAKNYEIAKASYSGEVTVPNIAGTNENLLEVLLYYDCTGNNFPV